MVEKYETPLWRGETFSYFREVDDGEREIKVLNWNVVEAIELRNFVKTTFVDLN